MNFNISGLARKKKEKKRARLHATSFRVEGTNHKKNVILLHAPYQKRKKKKKKNIDRRTVLSETARTKYLAYPHTVTLFEEKQRLQKLQKAAEQRRVVKKSNYMTMTRNGTFASWPPIQ